LEDLKALGTKQFTTDFHCYTGWTTLDLNFTGVPFKKLLNDFNPSQNWQWLLQVGADSYTTNAPREVFERDDIFLVYEHQGSPLSQDHGSFRIINNQLYGSKSCKFLLEIHFMNEEMKGFWEIRGVHHRGGVWNEERFDTLNKEVTGIEEARRIIKECDGISLDLSGLELDSIPEELYELKFIKTLNLNNNRLKELPKELCIKMQYLNLLSVNSNQIEQLPDEIGVMKIGELWIGSNKLTSLPETIINMSNLSILGVDTNQITHLPPNMDKMESLSAIFADYNQITHLPVELSNITDLRALLVSNNPLEDVPTEYSKFTEMSWLGVNGCKSIPEEVIYEGTVGVFKYLKEKHEEKLSKSLIN